VRPSSARQNYLRAVGDGHAATSAGTGASISSAGMRSLAVRERHAVAMANGRSVLTDETQRFATA
jgi:hypothetical protein